MPLGTFLGGAGDVRAQNMNAETASRQVDLNAINEQQRLQQEQVKGYQSSYDDMVKNSVDTITKALTEAQKGDDNSFKNAQAATAKLIQFTSDVGKQLVQHGIIDGAKLQQIQGILQTASNVPPPSVVNAQAATQAGAVAGAEEGARQAQKPATTESPFAKIDPADYTSESIQAFLASGDYSKLIPNKDPSVSPYDTFKMESGLRDEFSKETKSFTDVNDSYGRIIASSKNPSAAGDLALVFNYMKMLDPGSTVREGEFATAQNSGGIPDRVQAIYNKILNGERLNDKIRDDFIDRAQELYGEASTNYKKRADEFTTLAQRMKLDPKNIIFNRQLYNPAENTKDRPPLSSFIKK